LESKKKQRPDPVKSKPSRKLSNKDRGELKNLPKLIETLEAEQEVLHQKMADPTFYQQEKGEIAAVNARTEEIQKKLEAAFERWEALEGL
jgi:ATP-binding cassette subfamily F protein uup